jgi:uncharacterized protein YfaP (DUF2135 family)
VRLLTGSVTAASAGQASGPVEGWRAIDGEEVERARTVQQPWVELASRESY